MRMNLTLCVFLYVFFLYAMHFSFMNSFTLLLHYCPQVIDSGAYLIAQLVRICLQHRRPWFDPRLGRSPGGQDG